MATAIAHFKEPLNLTAKHFSQAYIYTKLSRLKPAVRFLQQ